MILRLLPLPSLMALLLSIVAFGQTEPLHPLEPLTADEINRATGILQAAGVLNPDLRILSLDLAEPPKAEVLSFNSGSRFRRDAAILAYEYQKNRTIEGTVDLRLGKLSRWEEIKGVQAPLAGDDWQIAASIAKKDPSWVEAIKKRGINDLDKVLVENWASGYFGDAKQKGRRLNWCLAYYRPSGTNHYGQPIEGLYALIDLNEKKIVKLVDTGAVPIPVEKPELDPASIGKLRPAPARMQIIQPEGPGFTVKGNLINWQKWQFRFTVNWREGLVLHTVGYQDDGRLRSILYRGSLSEMVVPYSDPSEGWYFRNAFDEGEYGMGLSPLEGRLDVPENAMLLDVVSADKFGKATVQKGVVAIYERDGGVLWRHTDYVTTTTEARRSRELVVTTVVTEGNYDYCFNWVFRQDGSLEMETLLTGIMSVKGIGAKNEAEHMEAAMGHPMFGHLVAPNINAVHHQHFFNFRLDLDIDGVKNTVLEQNTSSVPPGPKNPMKAAFVMRETPIESEMNGRRNLNLLSQRKWKIVSSGSLNTLGQKTGYTLVPGENSFPYANPLSWIGRRAQFMSNHLWVTQFARGENHAAGEYVNGSQGGDGLVKWMRANRNLRDDDVVLWYTFGITHIPRPEDWPVMPVHKAGFKLIPNSFFDRNPALDLPR